MCFNLFSLRLYININGSIFIYFFFDLQNVKDINKMHILEPKCTYASPDLHDEESEKRSLLEDPQNSFILSPPRIPDFWCHVNYKQ